MADETTGNAPATSKTMIDQPYVGPRPFARAERMLFFGRDREARDLLNLVISRRLTLFYAQSGAGKSSLVNTRLIPGLEESGFIVLPVGRVGGAFEALPPTENIFVQNLMQSLAPSVSDASRFYGVTLTTFLARLGTRDGEHYDYDDTPSSENGDSLHDYVLIIDQFEELVATHPERWEDRADFFRQIDAAMKADPHLWVVLVLRADYVAMLDPFAHLVADKLRARFYMERMERAAAQEAITEPARLGGRPFAPGVAAALVDNLCRVRTAGQAHPASGQYVEPVQLQVVCLQLWNNLRNRPGDAITFDNLRSLTSTGDLGQFVDDALATFYEEQLALVLDAVRRQVSVRELRDWFSLVLITGEGTRNLVYQGEQQTGGIPNAVVKELESHYLVRSESRSGGRWIELVHDRFIEPIQSANDRWRSQFPFVQAAAQWQNRPEFLLRGPQLRQAELDLQRFPDYFGALERDFIADSLRNEQAEEEQRRNEEAKRRREAQRLRVLLALAAVALVLMAGLTFWAVRESQRANDATLRAQEQAALAREAAAEANRQTRRAENANRVITANQLGAEAILAIGRAPQRALLLAAEAMRIAATPQTEQSLHETLAAVGGIPLHGHGSPILTVAASSDGRWVATGSLNGDVMVWDVPQAMELAAVAQPVTPRFTNQEYQVSVYALAFSPDSAFLASAGDFSVRIRRADDWNAPPSAVFDLGSDTLVRLTFSPDGRWLAGAGYEGTIWLWRGPTFDDAPLTLRGHQGAVYALAFSSDGRHMATGGDDRLVHLWRMEDQVELAALEGHFDPITALAFSPEGGLLASGSADRTVLVWNAALEDNEWAQATPLRIIDHDEAVDTLAFSQNGAWLATGAADNFVRVFEPLGETPPRVLRGHTGRVRSVIFTPLPQGWLLASASDDGSVRLWNSGDWDAPARVLRGHEGPINAATLIDALQPILASAGEDGATRLWPLTAPFPEPETRMIPGQLLTEVGLNRDGRRMIWVGAEEQNAFVLDLDTSTVISLTGHLQRIIVAALNGAGNQAFTASVDGTARLWDVESGVEKRRLPVEGDTINAAAFNYEGDWLATAETGGLIRVWNLVEGSAFTLEGHEADVTALAFDEEGRRLASASFDGAMRVWPLPPNVVPAQVLTPRADYFTSVAMGKDGQLLAAGANESGEIVIYVWNLAGGPRQELRGHERDISVLAFSDDGQLLVSGDAGGGLRLWRFYAAERPEPIVLQGRRGSINALAVNGSSQRLVSVDASGALLRWRLDVDELVRMACFTAGRTFTANEQKRYFLELPPRFACP